MSQLKHTPGPWEVSRNPPTRSRGIDVIATGRPKIVASVYWPQGDWNKEAQEHATANATLIAAAPDLLEALIDLVPRFERCGILSGSDPEFITIATKKHRDAIAKATGGGA